jgi:hypothetical protein
LTSQIQMIKYLCRLYLFECQGLTFEELEKGGKNEENRN